MLKLRALAIAAVAALSTLFPAKADYLISTPTVQPPNAILQTVLSGASNGKILNLNSPVDATGNAFMTLGNPAAITFGTGVLLPSFGQAQHFICDSGCGGGGGGGLSVTFGGAIGTLGTPGGFKDTSNNFQSLLGDTTNGEWVSVKASVLPGNAATATAQASILTALGSPFQAGGSIANTAFGISGTLPAFAATPTFNLGTLNGAATATLQGTGNTSLASIDTKTPSLGQALAAGSVPVVLTASQLTTLTPLSSVTVTQSTGTNLHMVCDSGCSSSSSPSFGSAFPATGTPIGMTQGGNLTALSGTAGALNVNLSSGSIANTSFAATQATAASLNATVVGTGTFATQAAPSTSAAWGLGAAGSAPPSVAQLVGGSDGTDLRLLATDASGHLIVEPGNTANTTAWLVTGTGGVFPASQSGTWNVTNISGTISLPTGAATSALQGTGNTSLATIATNLPPQGQALAGASMPVVLPAAQITTLTPPTTVTVQQSTAANLNMTCANCSGSGASGTDGGGFTAGSSVFAPGGGFFQTAATSNPLTTGQWGTFQVTANRALFTNLRNASGTEIGTPTTPIQVSLANTATNATAVKVDGSGVTQPVSGTVAFSNSSLAVTNTGTFATQVTSLPALAAGTNTIGAVIGPTADGSAASTAPVLIAGTTNGTATGTVAIPAITAAGVLSTDTTTLAGTALGAPSNYGTSPGAVAVQGVNAFVTNSVAVTNTGTFAVQATLQASSATAIGTVNPTTIGNWGLQVSTQNSATPTNVALMGGQFNTSPTTITSGNMSPLQMDNTGSVLVHITAGAGSGGTAIADNAAFTQSTTNETPIGCLFNSSYANATTGHSTVAQCDNQGGLYVNVKNTITAITPADSISTTTYGSGSPVIGIGLLWNGTTYDRHKSAGSTGIAAVGGAAAGGAAVAGNPVLIGGSDGTDARTVATDTGGNVKTINGASRYQLVAASSTATALTGGGGGATGDYLSHCDVVPTSTSPGVVTILDNSTAVYSFPGGASSLSNLVPFAIPIGANSLSGAWKITTGTGLSVVCTGKFT